MTALRLSSGDDDRKCCHSRLVPRGTSSGGGELTSSGQVGDGARSFMSDTFRITRRMSKRMEEVRGVCARKVRVGNRGKKWLRVEIKNKLTQGSSEKKDGHNKIYRYTDIYIFINT